MDKQPEAPSASASPSETATPTAAPPPAATEVAPPSPPTKHVAPAKRPSESTAGEGNGDENDGDVRDENASNKKRESSSRDVNSTAPFGGRLLTDESAVFDFNAWDHAPWGEEQEQHAQNEVARQKKDPVPETMAKTYHENAPEYWNKFYAKNENRFFKDRHWLRIEFPELFQMVEADAGEKKVLEIGCGAGNTMFPMLMESKNPKLFVYGCDFSKTAVEVVKSNPEYDPSRAKAFVWDLGSDDIPPEVEPESMDVLVLIFVLSALHPDRWENAMNNLSKLVKPGGLIVFRDYGRYDMAQLRFKKNRLLSDNFYVRGDGTRVYFFDSEEVVRLFGSRFTIEQNAVDRRLIVNRLRKVKMYRVWLQGKFRKPMAGEEPAPPSETTFVTTEESAEGGPVSSESSSPLQHTPADSPAALEPTPTMDAQPSPLSTVVTAAENEETSKAIH
ncbi:hypothetical protein DFQ27_006392 [Actinomortierella ambigua]|uniref:Methyltransferase type 12 domain-containing protein n=1 Tax=Actinomortierella ambigua TaxID=1343610 RepID=A0A9P6PWG1_9FUNG|nr:hypothetical protein DFQ27_006392 [Actinomortierella ambigua]